MASVSISTIDFDKWSTLPDGTIVLARNAAFIPQPVSANELPFPRADGSWGPHEISLLPQMYDSEHPYMSHVLVDGHHHFRLPQSLVTHQFSESDFYRYPQLPRRGYIKDTVTSIWKQDISTYRERVLQLYEELQLRAAGSYKAPLIAVARAENALFLLDHSTLCYRDAVEYLRGLKRFVAEIHAFLIWGNSLLGRSLKDPDTPRNCFRGVYVNSLDDFNHVAALGVPVYYLTGCSTFDPPDSRRVRLTELHLLCEFRTWADVYVTGHNKDVVKGKLVHSKPLMFYPPHVDRSNPLAFERAARGYGPRQDTDRLDWRMYRDSLTLSGRSPRPSLPRKPNPQDSDWRRQTRSLRQEWPQWGCDWDYFWHYHARGDGLPEHTDPQSSIPSHGAHFCYTIPPVHLLSNVKSDEKRTRVCFTWICMRRIWLLRYQDYRFNQSSRIVATTNDNAPPSPFHLHTQAWRDILHGQWWMKNSWPPQSNYDHRTFWRHGAPRLLGPSQEELEQEGQDTSYAYYSLHEELSPLLTPGRRLELKDFENKDLCNLVVYDLALTNHKLQFEETDDFVMHIDSMSPHDRVARINARQDLFRSSWDLPTDRFPWHDSSWEFCSWRLGISWYARFRSLIASWPREFDLDNIDWDKDLSGLDQWRFAEYGIRLVVFYRRTVMHTLGIAVAPLLRYPRLDTVDDMFLSL